MARFKIGEGLESADVVSPGTLVLSSSVSDIVASGNLKVTGDISSNNLDSRYVLTSSLSSSVVGIGDGRYVLTSSYSPFTSSVNAFTASISAFSQSVNGFTASFTSSVQSIGDARYATLTNYNIFTASHNTFSQSVNAFTASFTSSVQSIGDIRYASTTSFNSLSQSMNLFTASINSLTQSLNGFTSSFTASVQSIGDTRYANLSVFYSFSSSVNTLTQSLNLFTASHNAFSQSVNSFTASLSATIQSIGDTRYVFTSSYGAFTASHNSFSQSVNNFTASINSLIQNLNGFTASFTASVQSIGDIRYALSSSYNLFTASINTFTASVGFPQTGEIIVMVSGGGVDVNPLRPPLRSGNYSAYPFATFAGAINKIASDTNRNLNYNVYVLSSTGTFDGFNIEGFTGKGELVIPGSYKLSTVSSGVVSGTAGVGSTSTIANKPTGAANWPSSSTLRGKFIIVDSGGGASTDPYLPTIREIKSNTSSSVSFEDIFGFDVSSQFRIVDAGTVVFSSSINALAGVPCCVASVGNKNRIKIAGLKFSGTVDVFYGFLGYKCEDVYLQGCDFIVNSYMGCSNIDVGYASVNDSWFHSSSYLEAQHCDRVEYYGILQDSGSINVAYARYASVITDALGDNANAVKLQNIVKANLAANIVGSTSTPVVLQNIHHFTMDYLTGSNPGATTAVEISKGGQYIVTGAVISAGTNDFSIEGFADSWATLSGYGSYEARGTNVNWGSGYTYLKGTGLRVGAKSPSPGDELVVDGDVVWSGAEKSYGYKLSLGTAYQHTVATIGGTQAAAATLGYRLNYVSSPNNHTASVILAQAPAAGADFFVSNIGEYGFVLYPPIGGKMNTILNYGLYVPSGSSAIIVASGSGIDYRANLLYSRESSDARYLFTSSYAAGSSTTINGFSGTVTLVAGPNITINSGSGQIVITGSAGSSGSTDISALNSFSQSMNIFSASHNLFSQSINGFTASFSASVQSIGDVRYLLTSSFNVFSSSVNTFTASQLSTNSTQATLNNNLNSFTASHNAFSQSVNGFTASFTASVQSIGDARYATLANYNQLSSSHNLFTQSLNGFTASFTSSVQSIADLRYVFTSSYGTFTASINTLTQSLNGFTASFTSSVQSIGDARYIQTLNSIRGALTLTAGPNITINTAGTDISITGSAGSSGVTTSINGYSGSLSILAGPNITINSGSGFIMITGSAGGSGSTDISALNAFSASLNIFSQSVNGFTASFSSSVISITDKRYVYSLNGYSGSLSVLAGPNIVINSGSGFIMISGTDTNDVAINSFSQSINGFTASFSSSVQTIGDSRYILTSSFNVFTGSKRTVTAVFDGGGSVLTVGTKAYIPEVPYNATITGWRIVSPVAGSVVVDVWKDIYANFPATVIDTIAGSEKPTLSAATKNEDKALTAWTTAITAGDHLVFNVDSATTVTYVVVQLFLTVP